MSTSPPSKTSRQERLAAKLRENLRRRKAQAREMDDSLQESGPNPLPLSTGDS